MYISSNSFQIYAPSDDRHLNLLYFPRITVTPESAQTCLQHKLRWMLYPFSNRNREQVLTYNGPFSLIILTKILHHKQSWKRDTYNSRDFPLHGHYGMYTYHQCNKLNCHTYYHQMVRLYKFFFSAIHHLELYLPCLCFMFCLITFRCLDHLKVFFLVCYFFGLFSFYVVSFSLLYNVQFEALQLFHFYF